MTSTDQHPTHLLWLVTVHFCSRDYKQAIALIASQEVLLNGRVEQNMLHLVGSGEIVAWGNNSRAVDLDTLRKANNLRR